MNDLPPPPEVRITKQNPGPQAPIEKSIEEKMETITLAILAAAAAGLLAGVSEVSKKAVVDVYKLLKKLLKAQFGEEDPFIQAVETLEAAPQSKIGQIVLVNQAAAVKVDVDAEVFIVAQDLLAQIKAQPSGEQHIQAIGILIKGEKSPFSLDSLERGQP